MMDGKMVKMEVINGEPWFTFKEENGNLIKCDFQELKLVMKKIEEGKIKIQSMEL